MNDKDINLAECVVKASVSKSPSRSKQIEQHMSKILKLLNPNAQPEIMLKTPGRYADAMIEMTKGYDLDLEKLMNEAVFDSEKYHEIIIVKDIHFSSLCEHHLLPFFGDCCIGYIPDKKILGLSKFPRLVDALSKKLHLQERLTKEIADGIHKLLEPYGVVVLINSIHSCMCFRGIKAFDAKTQTIYTTGKFKEKESLDLFFQMLGR